MAENKTRFTDASIEDYIASRASEQQRADCEELMALLGSITRQPPRMWGPSIVGFGSYRYTYESGRTGEAPLAGFAIRGRELVLYLDCEGESQKALLSQVGKHKFGKCCLYLKQLADLDKSVLEQLVRGSIAEVRRRPCASSSGRFRMSYMRSEDSDRHSTFNCSRSTSSVVCCLLRGSGGMPRAARSATWAR